MNQLLKKAKEQGIWCIAKRYIYVRDKAGNPLFVQKEDYLEFVESDYIEIEYDEVLDTHYLVVSHRPDNENKVYEENDYQKTWAFVREDLEGDFD